MHLAAPPCSHRLTRKTILTTRRICGFLRRDLNVPFRAGEKFIEGEDLGFLQIAPVESETSDPFGDFATALTHEL